MDQASCQNSANQCAGSTCTAKDPAQCEYCGDGLCNLTTEKCSCQADCGDPNKNGCINPPPPPVCGNGTCEN